MGKDRQELLREMPAFGGISDEALAFLLTRTGSVSVPRGAYFFREGDQAQSMFVLESGGVAVIKEWSGRDYLLRELQIGDCFGEMALMDLFPRSASVLATEDARALELTTATLFELYQHDLEQFTMIQMNLGREVSRRLRASDQRAFNEQVKADVLAGHLIFKPL